MHICICTYTCIYIYIYIYTSLFQGACATTIYDCIQCKAPSGRPARLRRYSNNTNAIDIDSNNDNDNTTTSTTTTTTTTNNKTKSRGRVPLYDMVASNMFLEFAKGGLVKGGLAIQAS